MNHLLKKLREEIKEEQPKPKAQPKPSDRVDCKIPVVKIYHTKIIDTDTKNYVQQNRRNQ